MANDTYNNRKLESASDLPESARLARPAEFGGTRLIFMQSDPEGWAAAMRDMVEAQQRRSNIVQMVTRGESDPSLSYPEMPTPNSTVQKPEAASTITNIADYQHQPAPSIMTLPEDGVAVQNENLTVAQQRVKEALDEIAQYRRPA